MKFSATLSLIGALMLVVPTAFASDHSTHVNPPIISALNISGLVQTDYSRLTGDDTNFDLSEVGVRRGRVGVSGIIAEEIKFKFGLNIDTPSKIHLTDAYIAFQPGGAPVEIKLGQFKTPNSLDEQTSSKFIATLERAAFTDAFKFGRSVGASITHKATRHSLTLGVFGGDIKDDVLNGITLAGRATFSPYVADDITIHMGASFRYRALDTDQSLIGYGQGPVAGPAGDIIRTGGLGRSDLFLGVEAAALKGRYWAAGEFGATFADCIACTNDPTLTGGYLELGAFWSGQRTFSGGRFLRPEIFTSIRNGGHGAFSVVARFDTLDLTSGSVNGGAYNSITLGADWWPTSYTRLGLNIFKVNADFGDVVSGLAPTFATGIGGGLTSEDAHGLTIRFQLEI